MGIFSFFGKKNDSGMTAEQRYGKAFLMLLNENTRAAGYAQLEKLENDFPEAGIIVGQYYQGNRAKQHFAVAASAGIAEGHWGVCGCMPHNRVPNLKNPDDAAWILRCMTAAEGECPDAVNEMGNICHRLGWTVEAMYWYALAMCLEHPSGEEGMNGILNEWQMQGCPETYVKGSSDFTEKRHKTALLILKLLSGRLQSTDGLQQMLMGEKSEKLAAYMMAMIFEQADQQESAFMCYKVAAVDRYPHGLRCMADMMMTGRGTVRDPEAAMKAYAEAAKLGNAAALFVMGEQARNTGDKYLAACRYGMAYARGMEMAGERLTQLAESV